MLDLAKVEQMAQSSSPQELFAALVWQRRFNAFHGEAIITDLAKHSQLWRSFLFTRPIYAPDPKGLSFCGVIDTLLAMANYRPVPETSMMPSVLYPADTLYILAENQATVVAQLLDLGKDWRAGAVDVCDGITSDEAFRFQAYVKGRLQQSLWGHDNEDDRDAVVLSYWWD